MNYFEIGLLVWAIFTTLASIYELFIYWNEEWKEWWIEEYGE